MIIQVVGIVAHPDKESELAGALVTLKEETESKPGCMSCLLYQDWSSPSVLYLESRWEKEEHLVRYVASDTYKRLPGLKDLLLEEPTIEFLTVTERKGLDFIEAVRLDQHYTGR